MPVEFRCTGCSKLLRTPDESAGKKAKCPQCGEIVDVPTQSQSVVDAAPTKFQQEVAETNPFGHVASSPSVALSNPYESPPISAPQVKQQHLPVLEHRQISFDETLRMCWEVTQNQLGPIALCGLLYLAIAVGTNMATGFIAPIGQAMKEPAVQISGQIVQQVAGFFVNTYLQLGLLIFGLNLVRTGTARVSDMFQVGPYYLRGLGLFLLMTVIYYGVMLVCMIPAFGTILTERPEIIIPAFVVFGLLGFTCGMYAILRMVLAGAFLVDRNTGIRESLRLSDQYMAGNKLATFLLSFVTGIVGMLVVLVTCCIGSVVVAPFMLGVLFPTIYLLATGQPTYKSQLHV
ncbi:MAG: hypothetical protein H6821_01505 [Planctomycetaceae bacterium]|nr:hypothetical protein [Planctomycetales bacterium]MCB9872828.1 hypothetical protein [Planctomycetaceae bacterium]MCB9941423.1 hypothetical protein [Planctomycetaceae bacterium]HRX83044.1 hypothetical protein [Pirellulaceae bacterium]